MRMQRDDMAGSGATDPTPVQADPAEPMTGQIVPPPRVDSELDRPTDAVSPNDPAADPDQIVLDDPVPADEHVPAEDRLAAEDHVTAEDDEPADDLGPAENGESAVAGETALDSETVTDREPTEAPPLVTDDEAEDATPLLTEHEPTEAPPLVTDEVPAAGDVPPDAAPQSAPGQAPVAAPVAVADTPDTTPAAALAEQQWPAIQSLFVDNPRGAVERAEAAAGEVAASLIATLEREQADLRASWQQNADTEQLRTALQRYRAFCGRLEGMS
jgi:hypothetical protein